MLPDIITKANILGTPKYILFHAWFVCWMAAHERFKETKSSPLCTRCTVTCANPERGWGQMARNPLKNHKYIWFLRNTGPDSQITKLPSQHSMFGQSSALQQNAI